MYITVHLRSDIVSDMERETPRHNDTAELQTLLTEMGAELLPLHPGVDDPELGAQFFIEVPDEQSADDITMRLMDSPAVEAVYAKPPEEPPST